MRAYRHAGYGSYGSTGGSYGGSSGGSYGGSSGGSYGGSSYGGSAGGYATSISSDGYSSAMPIESYRVINEVPSNVGGEIISTPAAAAPLDSTAVPADGGLLVVQVPADATIFVNGSKTSSQGNVRRYLSRGLVSGQKYEFVVRMSQADGQEATKVVSLAAGERSTISFTTAAEAAVKTSVTLRVPADAKVWLAGNATASSGELRQFETTSLPAGSQWKQYEIKVATVVDGRERAVSKVIDLSAGDRVELELDPTQRTAAAETTASLR